MTDTRTTAGQPDHGDGAAVTGGPATAVWAPSEPDLPRSGGAGLAILFLLPALVFLVLLVVYPTAYTFVRSLFDNNGHRFVGFGNYADMFSSKRTLVAIKNNAIWVVVAPTVVTVLGLIFAVLTERVRWSTAFKFVLFMPMAIGFLASGVIFRLVYEQDPDQGLANAVSVGVHDTFFGTSHYPKAIPREGGTLARQQGAYVLKKPATPGSTVLLPLVGLLDTDVPSSARPAKPAAAAASGAVSGTVWVDFKRGGGGKPGAVDPGEKGLPGVRVQAVSGGKVAASATSADDGTFVLKGLGSGPYQIRLAASNFGQPYEGVTWLGPSLATPAIIAAYIWMWAGFAMVLVAAGLSAIPRDALEAARVDGATEWQVFRRVTVPLLSPVLLVVLVTLVINVLKIFDLVFIIAPDSVQDDANVLALEMWRVSFGGQPLQGLGSAIAIFLFLLVIPAMLFNIRRFRSEQR